MESPGTRLLTSGGKGEFYRRTRVKQGHFREAGKSEVRKRKPKGIKCLTREQTLNFGQLLANVAYKRSAGDRFDGQGLRVESEHNAPVSGGPQALN